MRHVSTVFKSTSIDNCTIILEQMFPLDLFLEGFPSVMVTISTWAGPHIPSAIIKSISVLFHAAELRSCSFSNSLFVDYWQDTALVNNMSERRVHCQWKITTTCTTFPSVCVSLSFPLRYCPETTLSFLFTRDFLTIKQTINMPPRFSMTQVTLSPSLLDHSLNPNSTFCVCQSLPIKPEHKIR